MNTKKVKNTESSRESEIYSLPLRIENINVSIATHPYTGSFWAAVDPPPKTPCTLVHFGSQ